MHGSCRSGYQPDIFPMVTNSGRSKQRPCAIGHAPGSHSHKPDPLFLPQAGGGQEGVSGCTTRCAVGNRTYLRVTRMHGLHGSCRSGYQPDILPMVTNPGRSKRRPCAIGHAPGSHSHKPHQLFLPQAGGGQVGVSRCTARCAVSNRTYWDEQDDR